MTIKAYIHCKACLQAEREDYIMIGLSDPETIVVHCAACGQDVGRFKLATPLPALHCNVCNEPIGPNHHH